MNSYPQELRQQLLDGKKQFSTEDYGNDKDRFYTECLVHIRKLRDRGVIEQIDEVTNNVNGDSYVFVVDLIGSVDYEKL